MKKYILDTDIGVDCDDAAALALLLNLQKEGKGELVAITTSTTRVGATSTIKAICDYYGAADMPIGKMSEPVLPCDAQNNYAEAVMKRYGEAEAVTEGVELLRKTLSSAEEKITLIAIGPLTNICKLLKSESDEYSALNGIQLVKEKVDRIYIMGGVFEENYEKETLPNGSLFSEWNILQDVPSARYVAENFPREMIYCPFEAGNKVLTELGEGDNPVWFSMRCFAVNWEHSETTEGFKRMSWDPVTCMVAMEGTLGFYDLSESGCIRIDEKGITVFDGTEDKGHRFLKTKGNFEKISEYINTLIEKR